MKNRIYAIREKLEKSLSDLPDIKGVSEKQIKYANDVRNSVHDSAIKYWNEKLVFLQNWILSKEKKGRTDLDKVSEGIKTIEDDLPYILSLNNIIFSETSAKKILDSNRYHLFYTENNVHTIYFTQQVLLQERKKKKTEENGN